MRITMWMIREPGRTMLKHIGAHHTESGAWNALLTWRKQQSAGHERWTPTWRAERKANGYRAVRVTVTDYTTARALLAETHTEDGC